MATSGVRLNEVLVAISMATDLGLGQPSEHMVRSARLSMRLGDRLRLDSSQLAVLYDVSLLTYVGCPVFGNEAALVFGDDIDFRSGTYDVDLRSRDGMRYMLGHAGKGASVVDRWQQALRLMATGGRDVAEQMANHCSAAGLLADRLTLGGEVRTGIEQSYARWDGKGVPGGLRGDQLSLAARVSHVADAAEVLERRLGLSGAVETIRSRRGTHFDPEVVDAFATNPSQLFDGIGDDTIDQLLELEPVERAPRHGPRGLEPGQLSAARQHQPHVRERRARDLGDDPTLRGTRAMEDEVAGLQRGGSGRAEGGGGEREPAGDED